MENNTKKIINQVTYFYDSDNRCVQKAYSADLCKSETRYVYNEQNLLIYEDVDIIRDIGSCSPLSEYHSHCVYIYNTQRQLIRKINTVVGIASTVGDARINVVDYTYDMDGNLYTSISRDGHYGKKKMINQMKYKYHYDDNNHKIKESFREYDPDEGDDEYEKNYEYNDQGQLVCERKRKDCGHCDDLVIYYYYNDNGLLIKSWSRLYVALYEYDEAKRIIRKTTTSNIAPDTVVISSYLYNENGNLIHECEYIEM